MQITGKATIAGFGSFALTWAALTAAYAAMNAESASADHSWKEETLTDPNTQEIITYIITDETLKVTFEGVPIGTTGHNTKAVAAAGGIYPAPRGNVAISGCNVAMFNYAYWLYAGGSWQLGPGKPKFRFTLEKKLNIDDTGHQSLATSVS